MPKLKTNKAITKRIKVSGSGKLLRRKANRSHNLAHQQAKTKRTHTVDLELTHSDLARVKQQLRQK